MRLLKYFVATLLYGAANAHGRTIKPQGVYDVRCTKLGVSFSIPIFKDWEPKSVGYENGGCIVELSWPDHISYDSPRRIVVDPIVYPKKGFRLEQAAKASFKLGSVQCDKPLRRKDGLLHGFAFDPTNWVKGYARRKGQWDYLQFYAQDRGAQIRIDGGVPEQGFSIDQTVERIISTFAFFPSTK